MPTPNLNLQNSTPEKEYEDHDFISEKGAYACLRSFQEDFFIKQYSQIFGRSASNTNQSVLTFTKSPKVSR